MEEAAGAGARPTDFDAAVESRDRQLHALEAAIIAECKEKEVLVRRLEAASTERVELQNALRSFLMEQDNVWSRRYGCAPPTLSLSEVSDSPSAQVGGANSGRGGGRRGSWKEMLCSRFPATFWDAEPDMTEGGRLNPRTLVS